MFVGIDLGGTAIKGALIDGKGAMLSFAQIETPGSAKKIDDGILGLMAILASSAKISETDIQGVGIGSAGSIDKSRGRIITSPNIPALKNHPLARNLEKAAGARVFLENDATVALMGASWKGKSGFRNWIMLTLGTGIGGGAVIDGRVYTGQSGNAMEVGHMSIDHAGRECPCGNRGCLERYASASALARDAEALAKTNPGSSLNGRMKNGSLTALAVYEEALKKDRAALAAIREAARYLGYGIAALVNLFNPEAVVLGGGLSNAHSMLIPVIEDTVRLRALPGLKENVRIIPVKDPSRVPSIGAAKMAMDALSGIPETR
ncbi:MAG TPA: ROK family protein [Spirochaetota bacterium]|nr:ROK family protein [Spirochaetota bacterium]HSA14634.1 ROK family protein [Spirochaetota bacterium]